jgi:hypothetical protein
VGFTPDFVGATRSTPVKAKNFIREFIGDNFYDITSKVSKSCSDDLIASINSPRAVYSAGYDSCFAHLREYFKDNTTEDVLTRDEIIRIADLSKFKWFAAPVCEFSRGLDVFDFININPLSYSGHYTEKIIGKFKGDADTVSRNVAYKLWTKIAKKPLKNLYLWKILGREKDIKFDFVSNEPKEVGTRVVLACEAPITYLLMWFAQKMNYILGYANWDRTYNLCGEFNATKYYKLVQHSYDYDYVLEADWSYYDSNIDTNFLEVGSSIICSGLPDDKLHNNIVTTIISSIVTKYVILPPGIVAELNRSQPSGHPFGSLVNCNVNLLYWCIIGYKIYGDDYVDNMRVEVYGDDTRAYFKHHPNLSNIDQYIAECGLKSDLVLPNLRSTKFVCEKSSDIDFLKRRFNENGVQWNHKKMFDKWLYQSRNRNFNDQIKVITSYLESVPVDEDLTIIVKLFISWVEDKYYDKIERDALKSIKSIKSLIDDGSVTKGRFKYEFGNHFTLKSYDEQLNLHSFSVSRPKYVWVNEKFEFNSNISKMLILYSLGLTYNQIAKVRLNDFSGMNHPPPVLDNDIVSNALHTELTFGHDFNMHLAKVKRLALRN